MQAMWKKEKSETWRFLALLSFLLSETLAQFHFFTIEKSQKSFLENLSSSVRRRQKLIDIKFGEKEIWKSLFIFVELVNDQGESFPFPERCDYRSLKFPFERWRISLHKATLN